jgi:hypothetical protein
MEGNNSPFPRVSGVASGGQICLADPGSPAASPNACPLSLQKFSGPNATTPTRGTQLRVAVNINASDSANGFDIILVSDHAKLKPFDADLTGSIFPPPPTTSIIKKCIGRVGSCSSVDTLDTLHLAVGGSFFTTFPTFGLLFTAVYDIVGNTTAAGSNIAFQTGCGPSTSLPPLCIILTSGGFLNVQLKAARTASYATDQASPFTPFFKLSGSPMILNFTSGASAGSGSTITMTELNGFTCAGVACVNIVAAAPTSVKDLSASVTPGSLGDPPPPGNTVALGVSISRFTPAGVYTIILLGEPVIGSNAPLAPATTYLGAVANVTVTVVATSDFVLGANPSTVVVDAGNIGNSKIFVAGGRTFTGTISLSQSVVPSTGLNCNLASTIISLTSSPSLKTSFLSCASIPGGTYTVTVNGVSGSTTHSAVVTYIVPSFVMSANATSLTVKPGSTGVSMINATSSNGFSGTVTMTATLSLSSSTLLLTPGSIAVKLGGTNSSILMITLPTTAGGTYSVNVTGASGAISQSIIISVATGSAHIVIVSVTASVTTPTIGQTVTFTVTLNNTGTISGNFSLWINWGSIKVTTTLNDTIAPGATKTETLTWDTTGLGAQSNTVVAVLSTTGGANGPSVQATGQAVALAAPAPPLLNNNQIFIIAGVIIVAAIIGALAVLLRRRKRQRIV